MVTKASGVIVTENKRQAEKTEIFLVEIFSLNPEIEKGLPPHVAFRYKK